MATGKSVKAVVQQVRMNHARRLLVDTSQPVNEVARQCGFADGGHFTRTFKQQFGLTPTQYRRNN